MVVECVGKNFEDPRESSEKEKFQVENASEITKE
jgi:hypothetical protein